MYIEPNTDIWLIAGVRINNTYNDTIYYNDTITQFNYFNSKVRYRLAENTYQRVQKGVARVGLKADLIYDVNYMMFRNANFGSKWFYAFVNKVEYINNEVSDVYFEIDVIQTWCTEYQVLNSFVEREHSEHDSIGYNILPEPLSIGELIYEAPIDIGDLDKTATVIGVCDVDEWNKISQGNMYDNVYCGMKLYATTSQNADVIDTAITSLMMKGLILKPDNIVTIYTIPSSALPGSSLSYDDFIPSGTVGKSTTHTLSSCSGTESFGNYTPVNKKMYTYPYNFLSVTNNCGESLPLRYEYFNGSPKLEIKRNITQPVEAVAFPINYKGYSGDRHPLTYESLSVKGFPACSWNYDTYKTWLSRAILPSSLDTGVKATQTAMKYESTYGRPYIPTTSVIGTVGNILSSNFTKAIESDTCRGSVNNGNLMRAHNLSKFTYCRAYVQEQTARVIDEFFTKYGYACNQVKQPGFTNRPHWNYIKTVGCEIVGSVPADDMRKICEIMDKGITFWRYGDEVGIYSFDNSPVESHNE